MRVSVSLMRNPHNQMDRVSFETTCFGWETATLESLDVAKKLAHVADLQRQVKNCPQSVSLDPQQIGALLFQGARLVTAVADGELLGYAITARSGGVPHCELLVSPRAAHLPVGTALLERLSEAAQH